MGEVSGQARVHRAPRRRQVPPARADGFRRHRESVLQRGTGGIVDRTPGHRRGARLRGPQRRPGLHRHGAPLRREPARVYRAHRKEGRQSHRGSRGVSPDERALAAATREGSSTEILKPDNVFSTCRTGRDPHQPIVKLLDFGIAKLMGRRTVAAATGDAPFTWRSERRQAGAQQHIFSSAASTILSGSHIYRGGLRRSDHRPCRPKPRPSRSTSRRP